MALSTYENVLLPPQFPTNLKVLAIDQDITYLHTIVQMCKKCNYQVTTCSTASFALNHLKKTENYFDVVLVEADQLPDIDFYYFLQHVTQEFRIPLIVMSVDESTSAMMKAIVNGACDYFTKPVEEYQIKKMWHHVARKYFNENPQYDQALEILDMKGYKKRKRDEVDHNKAPKETKKNRLSWSLELHQQFIEAVNQLGIQNAVPRKIQELTNVPGLTIHQIASHLQKWRLYLKKSAEETHSKNEMPKRLRKKSKFDQFHVLSIDTQSNPEVANLVEEHDTNVALNSSIQCDNVSPAQQNSTSFEYLCVPLVETQSSLEGGNLAQEHDIIIQCDNVSPAQQDSTSFECLCVPSVETQPDFEVANWMSKHNLNVVLNSPAQQHSISFEDYQVSDIDFQTQLNSTPFEEFQVSDEFIANLLADESNINLGEVEWPLSEYEFVV